MKEFVITFLAALVITSIWTGMGSAFDATPQNGPSTQSNISQQEQAAPSPNSVNE